MNLYTKEELFELIKNSPEKFSEWKSQNNDEINLSEIDFSHVTLENIDFSDTDLSACSFADSHLILVNFNNTDLTSAEFTRATVQECNFNDSVMTGVDYSYATVTYSNFTDADMAGCVFQETDLTNSDLSGSYNLSTCRFDEETIWPEAVMLPEDFDSTYFEDLSSLKDNDDANLTQMDY